MFSRVESKRLTQEFWTGFGKDFPHKWMLYNTKIKEVQLKFVFTRKIAQVALEISSSDDVIQEYYWEKIIALKKVLLAQYLPEAIFDKNYELPEGKKVSRVYVALPKVSIHNKADWQFVQQFFVLNMLKLEEFFTDFEDFLKS